MECFNTRLNIYFVFKYSQLRPMNGREILPPYRFIRSRIWNEFHRESPGSLLIFIERKISWVGCSLVIDNFASSSQFAFQ